MPYPIADNEELRVRAVADLMILDTPHDREFDGLVELARDMLGFPVGLISILDRDRQWFKATSGLEITETDRESAFCNHTICGSGPFLVEDALLDPRFMQNPLVTGEPFIRAYAGVPLFQNEGYAIGSLCIVDSEPRRFEERDLLRLQQLADVATSLLRQYRGGERLELMGSELKVRHDIIERQAADLDVQKRIFDEVSTLSKLGAWTRDLRTGTFDWSDEMYALHEVGPDFALTAESIASFYQPDDFLRLKRLVEESDRTARPYTFEGEMVTAKGNHRYIRLTAQVQIENGVAIRRYGTKQDITSERLRTEEITRLAERDSLSGLHNRRFFENHLKNLSRGRGSDADPVHLLVLDLDGFKDVNDSHGHAAGDHILNVTAERLRASSFEDALVARIGGDEFAIVLKGGATMQLRLALAERIVDAVAEPIPWMGHTIELTISIGIASRATGDAIDPEELLLEADLALYAAKDAGRNRAVHFDSSLRVAANRRFQVLKDVKAALNDDRFELYYQPKVRLRDKTLCGFEALIRMNDRDGKIIAPGAFAEALVDPKLGVEIGNFVIRSALDQAERWDAEGISFGSIAINLSAAQFRDTSIADFILREISARSLAPHMLEIEVTEGVFLSRTSKTVLEVCRKLKQSGVRIAFDDFGTGFASLTHLMEYPVDIIKIDRSFVSTLTQRSNSAAIIQAIIGMSSAMGLMVVAEGVETEAQAEFLIERGCEYAQGYHYARPLQARQVASWLRRPERRVA